MNRLLPALLLCACACACGQKGPLFLPEESAGEVVVRPPPEPAAQTEPAPAEDEGEDAPRPSDDR